MQQVARRRGDREKSGVPISMRGVCACAHVFFFLSRMLAANFVNLETFLALPPTYRGRVSRMVSPRRSEL